MSKALILGGGSIRGAFQAGALCEAIEQGFECNSIYGVSVGAINALWIASKVGEYRSWRLAGRDLEDVWLNRIRNVNSIGNLTNISQQLFGAVKNNWRGLVDLENLLNLVKANTSRDHVVASGIEVTVGCTDWNTGQYRSYSSSNHMAELLKLVFASAVTPVIMPPIPVGQVVLTDGGLRHIIPTRDAIADGHDRMLVISCQQAPQDQRWTPISVTSLTDLIFRAIDAMSSSITESDLAVLSDGNIQSVTIRPGGRVQSNVPTALEDMRDIMGFTHDQVINLFEEGRSRARTMLTNNIAFNSL